MAAVGIEQAERQLDQLTVIFKDWYRQHNSEDLEVSRRQSAEFFTACSGLQALVYQVQPEERLVLRVGDVPVIGSSLTEEDSLRYHEEHHVIDAGSLVVLEQAKIFWVPGNFDAAQPTLYVGETDQLVSAGRVARALVEGGQLAVAEAAGQRRQAS